MFAYVNRNAVFESVTNGMSVADITNQQRLPAPIETGRRYGITLEVGYDKVDCYLASKLLISYTEPQKLFSIAGRDNKTGDLIVKVVNASDKGYKTKLQFHGFDLEGSGAWTTLTADSATAENSFEEPQKYIPQQKTITAINNNHEMEFIPNRHQVGRRPRRGHL
ncbi:MAG: hypothetical protein ICV79_05155 [Flavisolibacter sp.]|nr:hypothetical protein [Flavisolibacter sp.]